MAKRKGETYPIPINVDSGAGGTRDRDVSRGELLIAHPHSVDTALEHEIREEASTSVLHPHALALRACTTLEAHVGD